MRVFTAYQLARFTAKKSSFLSDYSIYKMCICNYRILYLPWCSNDEIAENGIFWSHFCTCLQIRVRIAAFLLESITDRGWMKSTVGYLHRPKHNLEVCPLHRKTLTEIRHEDTEIYERRNMRKTPFVVLCHYPQVLNARFGVLRADFEPENTSRMVEG